MNSGRGSLFVWIGNLAAGLIAGAVTASVTVSVTGCGGKPKRPRPEAVMAMRPGPDPEYRDDLDLKGLRLSLIDHLKYFRRNPGAFGEEMKFGAQKISTAAYMGALEKLVQAIPSGKNATDPAAVFAYVRENFTCHEIHGGGKWGEVFLTSYFDPVLKAAHRSTPEQSRPIFGPPKDMALIKVGEFQRAFPHWSLVAGSEQKTAVPIARGRVFQRRGVNFVVPYYSRFELDNLGLLDGQEAPIAYADPWDIFVMQIQGSGTLEFPDRKQMRIGYAAQNGHPYIAVGKFLKDKIPADEMSLQAIERIIRELPADEAQKLMDRNPSYVFFQKLAGEPLTTLGTPVRPGRTVATDRGYFPKGALAFLQFNKPVFAPDAAPVNSWQPVGRFVMDQDTGGAIRGTDRLDLYWGRGPEAKQAAGVMKQWGKLCYLVPKN
jgi:membrane-bound lytic murein transglycosylase A